jgi:hypothetical protein
MDRTMIRTAGLVVSVAAVCIALADDPDCPVLGGGGNSTNDGSVFVVGQALAGLIDGSVEVNQGAVPCWFSGVCPGDTNGDNMVGNQDLQDVLTAWATCSGDADYNPNADFDDDGCVGNFDLQQVLNFWALPCE